MRPPPAPMRPPYYRTASWTVGARGRPEPAQARLGWRAGLPAGLGPGPGPGSLGDPRLQVKRARNCGSGAPSAGAGGCCRSRAIFSSQIFRVRGTFKITQGMLSGSSPSHPSRFIRILMLGVQSESEPYLYSHMIRVILSDSKSWSDLRATRSGCRPVLPVPVPPRPPSAPSRVPSSRRADGGCDYLAIHSRRQRGTIIGLIPCRLGRSLAHTFQTYNQVSQSRFSPR
jgi:hypothetical protein